MCGSSAPASRSPAPATTAPRLFTALSRACPMCRDSASPAVVMITDGQVHDVPAGAGRGASGEIGAPLHVLLSGRRTRTTAAS